jgi:hypothetical protein
MDPQSPRTEAGIGPLPFAIGIVVLLVRLIVDPPVIAPLGGTITLAAVLDPQRPSLGRPPLQRQPRRGHRRADADPQLRAQGRRRARNRTRGVALPDRPALMGIYELEIGWAATANERRYLHWELLACEQVRAVFLTARDDVVAVLFSGDRDRFHDRARTLAEDHTTATTNPKGALQ